MKQWYPLVLVVLLTGAVNGCSGPDLSTPEATVKTAQQALEDKNWNRLYRTVSDDWKDKHLPRWRSHLTTLRNKTNRDLSDDDISSLSRKELFRTNMKFLANQRRWSHLFERYAGADFSIESQDGTTARVTISSRFPLPYREATLTKSPEGWKLHDIHR